MKRVLTIISVAVLALTTAVSCSKNNAIDIDRSHTITFVADDEVAFSRTELDATGKKAQWVSGDKCHLAYHNDTTGAWKQTSSTATLTDGKATFSFTQWGTTYPLTFYLVYPLLDQTGASTTVDDNGTWAGFKLPANQTPTLTSFDGQSDVLVSQPVACEAAQNLTLNTKFIRKSGLIRLHLAGLDEALASTKVNTVTVTAQEGALLAGEWISINLDTSAADPYSFAATSDTTPSNSIVADYSAQEVTVADLQTTDTNKGVWLSMLPAEITSLTVTVALDGGGSIVFAERNPTGMQISENNITPITLTFDKGKGDKATIKSAVKQTLTIKNSSSGLTASVTDADGNAVDIDAVSAYGLTTTAAANASYFNISTTSVYIRNTKAIGDYIGKLNINVSSTSYPVRYSVATDAINSTGSGTNTSSATTTKEYTSDDGYKYFNICKHTAKTGRVTGIVIEYYTVSTTEL